MGKKTNIELLREYEIAIRDYYLSSASSSEHKEALDKMVSLHFEVKERMGG